MEYKNVDWRPFPSVGNIVFVTSSLVDCAKALKTSGSHPACFIHTSVCACLCAWEHLCVKKRQMELLTGFLLTCSCMVQCNAICSFSSASLLSWLRWNLQVRYISVACWWHSRTSLTPVPGHWRIHTLTYTSDLFSFSCVLVWRGTICDIFIWVCLKAFLKRCRLVCFHVFREAGEDIQEWKAFPPSGLFFFLTAVQAHTQSLSTTPGCFLLAACLYTHTHRQVGTQVWVSRPTFFIPTKKQFILVRTLLRHNYLRHYTL